MKLARRIQTTCLSACAALLIGGAAFAHDHAHHAFPAGEPGDAKHAARAVEVTATDAEGHMTFAPDKLDIARGEQDVGDAPFRGQTVDLPPRGRGVPLRR